MTHTYTNYTNHRGFQKHWRSETHDFQHVTVLLGLYRDSFNYRYKQFRATTLVLRRSGLQNNSGSISDIVKTIDTGATVQTFLSNR